MYINDLADLFVKSANAGSRKLGFAELMMEEKGANLIQRLIVFKADQEKNDPERRQELYGPYEEIVRMKTGRLPDDYYEEGDDMPWGLRVEESRSSILWQVLSGILDHRPEFAAAYMAVSMDLALDNQSYEKELMRLNKQWLEFNQTSRGLSDHQHKSISRIYGSIACPACSVLTAMVCEDEGMNRLFKDLLKLDTNERKEFMDHFGYGPLLNILIPEQSNGLILSENLTIK